MEILKKKSLDHTDPLRFCKILYQKYLIYYWQKNGRLFVLILFLILAYVTPSGTVCLGGGCGMCIGGGFSLVARL